VSTATSKSSSRALGLAAAAPVLLGVFSLLLASGVPPVVTWFWPASPTNAAEAAALGDAQRLRMLAARATPMDAPLPVRPEFRAAGAPATMTPLEAAIRLEGATHREGDSILEVLLDVGVRPPADEVRRLYCVAQAVEAPEAAEALRKTFNVSAAACE
jgi:hypothetical protein